MKKHKVFKAVPRDQVPKGHLVVSSTWACKKKTNGKHGACINARGFEQVNGMHFDETTTASPVIGDAAICIAFTLMIVASWHSHLVDVQGSFPHGTFEPGEQVHMEAPQGFEKHCPAGCVLSMLKTCCGLRQAAVAFWRKSLKAFDDMKFSRSKADPCLCFKWTLLHGLIIWISWVNDCMATGKKEGMLAAKEEMKKQFDCDDVGEVNECVGCKIDCKPEIGELRPTQPVLLQSFANEFDLPEGAASNTPAMPGGVLCRGEPAEEIQPKALTECRSGVGKLPHLAKMTRVEMLSSVRELSRHMSGATASHVEAVHRAMKHAATTEARGLLLKPDAKWDGDPNFEFAVGGTSDSDCSKDMETRRSVSGHATFLNGSPITMKSKMQQTVTLSVTEEELPSATNTLRQAFCGEDKHMKC